MLFEDPHELPDEAENKDEDQFIFPSPIKSLDPMEVSPQSQFELGDHMMPSLSNIKSNRVIEISITAHHK